MPETYFSCSHEDIGSGMRNIPTFQNPPAPPKPPATLPPFPTLPPPPKLPATPTLSPDTFRETGKGEWFTGGALIAFRAGERYFKEGNYQEALAKFQETLTLHGEPSQVIQNLIGNSYFALAKYDKAVEHFTNALEIEDDATNRASRSEAYITVMECAPAIEDAKAALAMEPVIGDRIHTDAQANDIPANCLAHQGSYIQALQHAEAAVEIAEKHGYPTSEMEVLRTTRESIRAVAEGQMGPEDLIFKPAATPFNMGIQLLEQEQYEAAIAHLKDAQEKHGKMSGFIQTTIGQAYSALGQHENAMIHFNRAVATRDAPLYLMSRGNEYAYYGKCKEAVADAQAALAKTPYTGSGYHTDVEAYWILAICYHEDSGNPETALQHLQEATRLAKQHGHSGEDISFLEQAAASLKEQTAATPAP